MVLDSHLSLTLQALVAGNDEVEEEEEAMTKMIEGGR